MNDTPKPQLSPVRATDRATQPMPPARRAPRLHEGANQALQQSLDRRW